MKITTETTIACPPDQLWLWLAETERCKRWLKGLQDIQPTSSGPRRAGSTALVKVQEGRRVWEYTETTLVFDAPRRMRFSMVGGCMKGMEITVDYELEDLGHRTRLLYTCEAQAKGWMALFAPLFAVFGRMQVNSFFRTLKRLAEAEAGMATA